MLFIFRDSDAAVFHVEPDAFVFRFVPHLDKSFPGVFDRVGHVVGHDLGDTVLVQPDFTAGVGVACYQPYAGIGHALFHRGHHVVEIFRQVEVLVLQFDRSRFDFRQIQNIVDQFQQQFVVDMDDFDVFLLLLLFGRFHQQAGESDDGVQRRTDLVAHVGQKSRFQFVGLLSERFGLFQFFDHPFAFGHVVYADYDSVDRPVASEYGSCEYFDRMSVVEREFGLFHLTRAHRKLHDAVFAGRRAAAGALVADRAFPVGFVRQTGRTHRDIFPLDDVIRRDVRQAGVGVVEHHFVLSDQVVQFLAVLQKGQFGLLVFLDVDRHAEHIGIWDIVAQGRFEHAARLPPFVNAAVAEIGPVLHVPFVGLVTDQPLDGLHKEFSFVRMNETYEFFE